MATAADARNLFSLVRKGIDARAVHQHVRKPFRFLLCGDPALVAEMRSLLLRETTRAFCRTPPRVWRPFTPERRS